MPASRTVISTIGYRYVRLLAAFMIAAAFLLSACSTAPLLPYTEDGQPLVLLPASQAGIEDKRGRFREIFCAILDERGQSLPDYLPCDEALTRVGDEPEGPGKKVALGPSDSNLLAVIVPGVGWDCISSWLNAEGSAASHIRQFGYDMGALPVDALSSSTNNARQIRDGIMSMEHKDQEPNIVLIGYSKGAPDILDGSG